MLLPTEIVVIADADANEAGIKGAESLIDSLLVVAPVKLTQPIGCKDVRAWVCAGADRNTIESAADIAPTKRLTTKGSNRG